LKISSKLAHGSNCTMIQVSNCLFAVPFYLCHTDNNDLTSLTDNLQKGSSFFYTIVVLFVIEISCLSLYHLFKDHIVHIITII